MRSLFHTLALLLVAGPICAQTAPDTWWVQFTDKDQTPYSIDQPEAFLSARSIQRRAAQGIAVDVLDLPVDPAYISTVLGLGPVQLLHRSRWFNAITIRTADPQVLQAIEALPFVASVRGTRNVGYRPMPSQKELELAPFTDRDLEYGDSFGQVAMMNGHLLHDMNARGQGMLIGVLDSGFEGTDVLDAFAALRSRGGIVASRDVVDRDGDVYQDHWHGRSVLSCMAGLMPGALVGTAPMADYVLVRTEEAATEFLVEEDHWVAGVEWCDSLGVDILNTSLGYTQFQDSTQDHTYASMDGQTTRISIAAGIASRKGMIPVVSAGNQGASEWYYISAPADAVDILSVGAVGAQAQHAWFSSYGPSADGRVKPDVAAMGWGTTGIAPDGQSITLLNGTSFSAPLVSGLVACLWQLHPERGASEIMDAVRRTASQNATSDNALGYGIPDMMAAHQLLTITGGSDHASRAVCSVYPVPFSDAFTIAFGTMEDQLHTIELRDMLGRMQWREDVRSMDGRAVLNVRHASSMLPGSYLLLVDGLPWGTIVKVP